MLVFLGKESPQFVRIESDSVGHFVETTERTVVLGYHELRVAGWS